MTPAVYRLRFDGTPSKLVAVFRRSFGPVMRVFEFFRPGAKAGEANGKMEEMFARANERSDGKTGIAA